MLLGGIEAGGTKFIYGIADENGNIMDRHACPTTTPEETLSTIINYFKTQQLSALGIGSFGPIDLNTNSSTYGYITSTPKIQWQNTDILGILKNVLPVPIAFDTDVNGAILGESLWGAAQGVDSSLYLTIGTGIGGGAIINKQLIHGLLHPEMGHILVTKHPNDTFNSICPFHSSCLEGLASGSAIEKRWACKGMDLTEDHPAWKLEAYYLAQAIVNFILILSPQKIILGGGVMHQLHLFPLIRTQVQTLLNNYIHLIQIQQNIDNYIIPPILGDNAGFLGAIALGYKTVKKL